jgi:PPOX class probable F420-dependent enzyme
VVTTRPQEGEDGMKEALKKYGDLLRDDRKALAHLGTVLPGGGPHVTPVWFEYDGTFFRVNSAKGRVKDRNMRRNPEVALSIVDPDNPYRYVGVMGRVTEITEQGGDAHIDRLAKKYLGQDRYPNRQPGEVRVIYRIAPERVSGMG